MSANHLPPIRQLPQSIFSLKRVNASTSKELPNVLPNGNPFASHICYAFRRDEACLIRFYGFHVRRTLTSTKMHNAHKNRRVFVPLLLLLPLVVHFTVFQDVKG